MELEHWSKLSKQQQLLNIKSELFRAVNWQQTNYERFQGCLTRTLDLISTSFNDKKWHDNLPLLSVLYEEVAKIYINQTQDVQRILNAF